VGLYTYAAQVLANVNAAFAAAGITLPGLQYVAPGPYDSESFDCDQVVVSIDLLNRGRPGEPDPSHPTLGLEWSATITVAVCRTCMPTSPDASPPPAAAQNAAAEVTLADLDVLWRNHAAILAVAGCRHSGVVRAGLIDVQGALGGSSLSCTVDLLTI
jgi:hypothetical protein